MSPVTVTVPELPWETPVQCVTAALAAHLAPALVSRRPDIDFRHPRRHVLTVTGSTPTDVDRAADLYLSSAGITYDLRSAAA